MGIESRYHIADNTDFQASDFPEIVREWNEIKRLIRNLKHTDNTEIIISFLKNHMIRSELASAHADLVDILKTKNAVCHLEDLFVACKDNTMFTQSLEKYLIVHVKHPS